MALATFPQRHSARPAGFGVIQEFPAVGEWPVQEKEISRAIRVAPPYHIGRNIVAAKTHSLRDTACGKLRISQPQKQQMHMVAALLEAGEPRCEARSEEHTSELQSHSDLVCRLLLEKKKNN